MYCRFGGEKLYEGTALAYSKDLGGLTRSCMFAFAAAEFVETEEQIQDEPTGKNHFQPTPCS